MAIEIEKKYRLTSEQYAAVLSSLEEIEAVFDRSNNASSTILTSNSRLNTKPKFQTVKPSNKLSKV
jgi:hypothetical protein